jgi:hypothetical protein
MQPGNLGIMPAAGLPSAHINQTLATPAFHQVFKSWMAAQGNGTDIFTPETK